MKNLVVLILFLLLQACKPGDTSAIKAPVASDPVTYMLSITSRNGPSNVSWALYSAEGDQSDILRIEDGETKTYTQTTTALESPNYISVENFSNAGWNTGDIDVVLQVVHSDGTVDTQSFTILWNDYGQRTVFFDKAKGGLQSPPITCHMGAC